MASNSFGQIFKITTWGESHGKAIGVVIDGCPAGLELSIEDISIALEQRSPGKNAFVSPRVEKDRPEILSGVFEGYTTGAPISIVIYNTAADSSVYEQVKHIYKPGHANYTYLQKYGRFDYAGGGRSSARETACRVAAGAVARKLLLSYHIITAAYIKQIASIEANVDFQSIEMLQEVTRRDSLFCPDVNASIMMQEAIFQAKSEGNSLGAIVEFIAQGLPAGIGDPVYEKFEAKLASAMMSIPASKGFEIGAGFKSVTMKGSDHNDGFFMNGEIVNTLTNHSGGVLGGISTGMPVIGRVAFKPTSSIAIAQQSLTVENIETTFQVPQGSKHDPCVGIRAVPVVEAMLALVLADSILLNRCAKL